MYPGGADIESQKFTSKERPDAGSSRCQQYGHDNYGNRLIAQRSNLGTAGAMEPGSFDAATNHITGWTYNGGYVTKDGAGQTYAWDGEGRMTAFCPGISNPALCTLTWQSGNTVYTYGGDGKRMAKKAGDGTVTTFVYDAGGQLAAEYGGSGGVSGTQYLTEDHLGSTRLVMGAQMERVDYLPFGSRFW